MLLRFLSIVLLLSATCLQAQNSRWYLSYGLNRASYLNTTLEIRQPGYGRTIRFASVNAHDRPDYEAYASTDIVIPQFQVRLGYRLLPKLYIEGAMMHLKYITSDNHNIDGIISYDDPEKPSEIIHHYDDYVPRYEHSDGLNMVMLSVVRPVQLKATQHWYSDFSLLLRAGVGVPVAHSDNGIVSPSGELEYNNKRYHISGMGVMLGASLRYQLLPRWYIETEYHPMFVRIWDGLVAHGNSSHNVAGHQFALGIGFSGKTALRRRTESAGE